MTDSIDWTYLVPYLKSYFIPLLMITLGSLCIAVHRKSWFLGIGIWTIAGAFYSILWDIILELKIISDLIRTISAIP